MKLKNLTFRLLTEQDMPEVSSWFVKHKWPIAPGKNILPDLAYVAESEGVLLAVAWIYLTNSSIFWIEWLATNPEFQVKGIVSLKKLSKHLLEVIPKRHAKEDAGFKAYVDFLSREMEKGHVSKEFFFDTITNLKLAASEIHSTPQYKVGHLATPNTKLATMFEKQGWSNSDVAHLLWYHLDKRKKGES